MIQSSLNLNLNFLLLMQPSLNFYLHLEGFAYVHRPVYLGLYAQMTSW